MIIHVSKGNHNLAMLKGRFYSTLPNLQIKLSRDFESAYLGAMENTENTIKNHTTIW